VPAKATAHEDGELRLLLHEHALGTHALAEKALKHESELLDFLLSGQAPHPSEVLGLICGLEKLRRSAANELKQSAVLLEGRRERTAPVQIAVVNSANASSGKK